MGPEARPDHDPDPNPPLRIYRKNLKGSMMFDEEHVIYRYKYLPFNEGSLKALTESTIKFTSPLDFNDPFDCKPYYDPKNMDQLPQLRPDLFKKAGDIRGLSPAKRIQKKNKYVARLKRDLAHGDVTKKIMSKVGIVSLSKNALSIPMWSHYADFHRGFILEFRIPIKGLTVDFPSTCEILLPFPVKYKKERPHVDLSFQLANGSPPDVLINEMLLTKSLDWQYEEEERVIDNARGPGIHYYCRDQILCSVIAGIATEETDYRELASIVRKLREKNRNDVEIFRAEEKKDEYRLIVHGHPRLQDSP